VCTIAPSCCDTGWDDFCVGLTGRHCGPTRVERADSGTTDGGDLGLLLSGWTGTLEYPRSCAPESLMAGGGESSEENSELNGGGSDQRTATVLTLAEVLAVLKFSTTHEFVTWVTQLELEEFFSGWRCGEQGAGSREQGAGKECSGLHD